MCQESQHNISRIVCFLFSRKTGQLLQTLCIACSFAKKKSSPDLSLIRFLFPKGTAFCPWCTCKDICKDIFNTAEAVLIQLMYEVLVANGLILCCFNCIGIANIVLCPDVLDYKPYP